MARWLTLLISLVAIGIIYAKSPELPGLILFSGVAFAFALASLLFTWQARRERKPKQYGRHGMEWRSRDYRHR